MKNFASMWSTVATSLSAACRCVGLGVSQWSGSTWLKVRRVCLLLLFEQTVRGLGLPFERKRIAGVREEPRIREQDFGEYKKSGCKQVMK